MHRAYSALNVKDMSDDKDFVYVDGVASTPTTDRQGDNVNPLGAKFVTPMPLLWQHRSDKPVGHVTFAKPTKFGIPFKARIPKIAEPGVLKDRIDEAIQSLRLKLVAFVSIGFQGIGDGPKRTETGYQWDAWEWLELSLVTIPAQPEAVITSVKSLTDDAGGHLSQVVINAIKSADHAILRAAPGYRPVVRLDLTPVQAGTPPGASGNDSPRRKGVVYLKNTEGN